MKRILIYFFILSGSLKSFGQGEWVKASIDNAIAPNSTGLYISTNTEFDANKCDNIVFTVRVPKTAGNNVVVTESFHAASIAHITFAIQKLNVDDGTWYYYLVNGTGSVLAATGTIYPINTSLKLLELTYSGGSSNGNVELANIENDIPGNAFIRPQFYIQLNVGDVTKYDEMFYGTAGAIPVNNLPVTGDDFVGTASAVVLPVKFLSFEANKNNNNAVLSWSVQNESAITDHYEIERSFNGRDFEMIGSVVARNNGNANNDYGSTDQNISALRSNGKIYYRVKQSDRDGRHIYTEIRSVRLDGKTFDVSVYPNPVVSNSTVNIDLAKEGKITVMIVDATGKKVNSVSFNGTKGLNKYSLNMNQLASGTYLVKVLSGIENKTISVVKK